MFGDYRKLMTIKTSTATMATMMISQSMKKALPLYSVFHPDFSREAVIIFHEEDKNDI